MPLKENIQTITHNSDLYWKEVDLRYNILRKPLGLDFSPEQLDAENNDVHLAYIENDKVLACLVLTKLSEKKLKMRQVAVDPLLQGKGYGRLLAEYAEDYARNHGYTTFECHARTTAVPFYLVMDWQIVGDEFTEVTIPHFKMEKQL